MRRFARSGEQRSRDHDATVLSLRVLRVQEVKAAEPTYKKDDFFDLLSCDALGGSAAGGPNDWRTKLMEQKRLDMETFGGLGGIRHGAYGRGRGGGRGGHGGPGNLGGGGPGRGGPGGGPHHHGGRVSVRMLAGRVHQALGAVLVGSVCGC